MFQLSLNLTLTFIRQGCFNFDYMADNRENKVDEFAKNPKRALFILAFPVMIAMFVQILYNIIDTAFVGRLGPEAIAALTFCFPLFFVLMSIVGGIGTGMSSRISQFMGSKNKKQAENAAMHGLLIALAFAFVLYAVSLIGLRPFFILLGAENNVITLSMQYMSIIMMGVFFMFPAYIMNSIFAAQGDTRTPMIINIIALVINGALDPLFIYTLGMGVRGAALASVIGFFSSLVMYIVFARKHSYLHITKKSFRFSLKLIRSIVKVGLPASFMMLLISVYVMFINRFMAHFGTLYVAAFGLASRMESIAVMPIIALSISTLTLTGMFYGAKKYNLLKNTIWFSLKAGIVFTSLIAILLFFSSFLLFRIFTDDPTLIGLAVAYMKINVFTFPLMAISMITARSMQGMGFGLPGLVITSVRIAIVAIPLAYVFVFLLGQGYLSVAIAMVVGGVAASIVALSWVRYKLNKISIHEN
jgi:putative MATE family efflux protein